MAILEDPFGSADVLKLVVLFSLVIWNLRLRIWIFSGSAVHFGRVIRQDVQVAWMPQH